MTQLLAALVPFALIAALSLYYSYRAGFDRVTLLLFGAVLALIQFHICATGWEDFTVDSISHMTYVEFLLDNHRLPTPEDGIGAAARHPPLYYVLCAALLGSARALELPEPEQLARYLSFGIYALFLINGMHILRLLLQPGSGSYYFALLLFFFWPVGITMAGRLSCDVMLFAGQAGAFYGLIRWIKTREAGSLSIAFWWAGLAVLGKNSGVVMVWLATLALAFTLWQQRRNIGKLLRPGLIISGAFAWLCNSHTTRHGWIMTHITEESYAWEYVWSRISSFNPFLFLYDTQLGLGQESFWNVWLHTLLLGNSSLNWPCPDLIIVQKVVWLAMLVYGVASVLRAWKKLEMPERLTLLLLAGFAGFMICAALYLLLRTTNSNYADARYAYPVVILFALMHGLAVKYQQQAGNISIYRVGISLSAAFSFIAIALLLTQPL